MAAVMKHMSSTDILFPEDQPQTFNDSFYSQTSKSNYSTYSQEVKYIFNPQVATRGPPSQSEYSEIDNFSVHSQRSSVDERRSSIGLDGRKPSPGNISNHSNSHNVNNSPASSHFNHKGQLNNNYQAARSATPKDVVPNQQYGLSKDPVPNPQYGFSIKPLSYAQRHNSTDALNVWGNEMSRPPQRHNSTDSVTPQRSDLRSAPPMRSISSDSAGKYPPRGVGPLHKLPKTPPKPKRLHLTTPPKPSTPGAGVLSPNQNTPHQIYATPVLNARMLKKQNQKSSPSQKPGDKSAQNTPLPAPPPYVHPPAAPSSASKNNVNSGPEAPWYVGLPGVGPLDAESFAARRRTWSPPTFSRMMGISNNLQLQTMRSYRSNEQLDVDTGENLYEDLDNISNMSAPPKITPHSGTLNKTPHERIIKPIAFKPIITPNTRYNGTPARPSPTAGPQTTPTRPQTSPPSSRPSPPAPPRPSPPSYPMSPRHVTELRMSHNHSQDDGYMSQDGNHSNQHSGSSIHLSNGLSHDPRSHDQHYNSFYKMGSDTRSESYSNTSSNLSRVSSNPNDIYMTTPSPSDSGVGELEAILRAKDVEIQQLRETMEKNESAIMQVHEQRCQNWQVEFRDHAEEWQHRLRTQQQKAFKTEQGLLMQLFKLQQERKAFKQEADKALADKQTSEQKRGEAAAELARYKAKVDELQWDLQQRTGEIALLKSQLKEAKDDTSNKSTDIVGLRSQVKELTQERDLQAKDIENLTKNSQQFQEDFRQLQDKLDASQAQLDKTEQTVQAQKGASVAMATTVSANDRVSVLEAELSKLRKETCEKLTVFQQEKEQWLDEKNKVVRYQKHLQLNYVQMMRKNKVLEAEVEQLTLELENRDIKLMSDGVTITEEESIC